MEKISYGGLKKVLGSNEMKNILGGSDPIGGGGDTFYCQCNEGIGVWWCFNAGSVSVCGEF